MVTYSQPLPHGLFIPGPLGSHSPMLAATKSGSHTREQGGPAIRSSYKAGTGLQATLEY